MILLNLVWLMVAVEPPADRHKRHAKYVGKFLLGDTIFESELFESAQQVFHSSQYIIICQSVKSFFRYFPSSLSSSSKGMFTAPSPGFRSKSILDMTS